MVEREGMHVGIIKRETKSLQFAREVHTRVWLSSRPCFPACWLPIRMLLLCPLPAFGTFNISCLPKEIQAQTHHAPTQVRGPAATALLWDVPMEHQVVLLPSGSSEPLTCMNLAKGASFIWRAAAQRGCADGEQQRPRGFLHGEVSQPLAKSRGRQQEAVLAVM